jgi:nucleoside-diphosphate-sugar epimerase
MKNILVIGSTGQIGSELTLVLRDSYGPGNVVAGGHKRKPSSRKLQDSGPYEIADCLAPKALAALIEKYRIDTIYHLAALLSATSEKNPKLAWDVNIQGLINVLDLAKSYQCAVFFPSSIGVFGDSTPKDNTPQDTIQRPSTMYGITKLTGELLCDYYFNKYNIDIRGVRYPGLISYETLPGGGTTDYAVEIFYEALKSQNYSCFLKEDTYLDMMYMPDAVKAAMQLMEADSNSLLHRNGYNVSAMSFSPREISEEIRKWIPEFKISYDIDPIRQSIADSWPNSMDDTVAREEWDWQPDYDLPKMAKDMLEKLKLKLKLGIE